MKTTSEGVSATKAALWTEVVKKVKVPKFIGTRVLHKGDVEVTPADDATLWALREIAAGRDDIKESEKRWPMVLIYDVDKDTKPEELGYVIAVQNEGLKIHRGMNS